MSNYSRKVKQIYANLAISGGWKKLSKNAKDAILEEILELLDSGFSDDQIMELFAERPVVAELSMVMRDASLDKDVFLDICASPILAATNANLPICQETVQFGVNTFSKLHLAYLVNIVDSWRYVTDQVSALQYDYLGIREMKDLLRQKRVSGKRNLVLTWDNVSEGVLSFLGLASYPDDIPVYTDSFLTDTIVDLYPTFQKDPTLGITEEVIIQEFTEYYIELITQLESLHGNGMVDIQDKTEYHSDGSLWALLQPGSDDPDNFYSRVADVRFDIPIPPSSEWAAATPAVANVSKDNSNVKVRFTIYSGTVHYIYRLVNGIVGRVSETVMPFFFSYHQIADRLDKELFLSQVDIQEDIFSNINIPSFSLLGRLSRENLTAYFFNILLNQYSPFSTMMAYSMPEGTATFAGMQAIPNPNYSSNLMFSNLVENLENFGQFKGGKNSGRSRQVAIPVPFVSYKPDSMQGYVNYRLGTDLSQYEDLFVNTAVIGNLSPDLSANPILDPHALKCYTRGDFVQDMWHVLPNHLAFFGNVNRMSNFENLKTQMSDYDKICCVFQDESVPDDLNRHFLIYENERISPGERNMIKIWIYPVFQLGQESEDFIEKSERVRTFQEFMGFEGSEYVDATRRQEIEIPNTLYDANSDFAAFYRRFKYQSETTLAQHEISVMWMKCEGGGFIAAVRGIAGKVLKIAGRAAREIAKPEVQKTIRGFVDAWGTTYDNHSRQLRESGPSIGISIEPRFKKRGLSKKPSVLDMVSKIESSSGDESEFVMVEGQKYYKR